MMWDLPEGRGVDNMGTSQMINWFSVVLTNRSRRVVFKRTGFWTQQRRSLFWSREQWGGRDSICGLMWHGQFTSELWGLLSSRWHGLGPRGGMLHRAANRISPVRSLWWPRTGKRRRKVSTVRGVRMSRGWPGEGGGCSSCPRRHPRRPGLNHRHHRLLTATVFHRHGAHLPNFTAIPAPLDLPLWIMTIFSIPWPKTAPRISSGQRSSSLYFTSIV